VSVQEILVLHLEERRAELLRRLDDGVWPAEPAQVRSGELVLESIAFSTKLEALYRTVGA
jgi:hypothetical protein